VHSTNDVAQYWYVFDLEKENGKYQVKPVQQVFTGWTEITLSEFN